MKQPSLLTLGRSSLFAALSLILAMFSPHTAHALPNPAAQLTVNSNLDTDLRDSVLTLREAIEIANGTLFNHLTDAEKAQLTGCSWSGTTNDWLITGGCGSAAVANTIVFSVSQVNLTNPLPTLGPTKGTSILGGSTVRIDGSGMLSGDAFSIYVNSATIDGLTIVNVPPGPSNQYSDIRILGGAFVQISNNYLGVVPGGTNCSSGGVLRNAGIGIRADQYVSGYIYGNKIGCHTLDGIMTAGASNGIDIGIQSDGTTVNGNFIGTIDGTHATPNTYDGIWLTTNGVTGSTGVYIKGNTIAFNAANGIRLDGNGANDTTSTHGNSIHANTILSNTLDGIALTNGAYANNIGDDIGATRNIIGGNQHGIGIYNSNGNLVGANYIGINDLNMKFPNYIGVFINNVSANNHIEYNWISGNSGDGVQLYGGSHHNTIDGNWIGVNAAGTAAAPNGLSGVAILNGAHDNLMGLANSNQIQGNGSAGVFISDNSTYSNTIGYNMIGQSLIATLPNAGDGIVLQAGTYSNTILANTISANTRSGIYVSSAAHANTISNNHIGSNQFYGIVFDGSGTVNNLVQANYIYTNGQGGAGFDGIGERNSATLNVWTQNNIYNNAGLGIDKNAYSDFLNINDGPFATITSLNRATGQFQGTGTPGSRVEVYLAYPDPSGYGEGVYIMGASSALIGGGGTWSVMVNPAVWASFANSPCFTTIQQSFSGSGEFGPTYCSYQLFLPLIKR